VVWHSLNSSFRQSQTKKLGHEATSPLLPLRMLIIRWFFPFLLRKMRHFPTLIRGDTNACTLVPTVFLRCGKTEFALPVSFFIYPPHRKREFEIPFLFSVLLCIENGIPSSIFVFRISTTLDNRILIVISFFRLSFLKDIDHVKPFWLYSGT